MKTFSRGARFLVICSGLTLCPGLGWSAETPDDFDSASGPALGSGGQIASEQAASGDCPASDLATETAEPAPESAIQHQDLAPPSVPSVKEFPKELAKNFRGLFTRDNLTFFIVGASATAGAATLDGTFRKSADDPDHFTAFGGLGGSLGNPGYLAAIVSSAFVAGRMTEDNRFKAMSYDLAQGYVLTTAMTAALKHGIGRARPDGTDNMSFPSGHASTAFMYATVLSHYYGLNAAIPAYALAGFVGISRVERNAHNLSDVVAGATLGYIVGRTVVRKQEAEPEKEHQFTWAPSVSPDGAGVTFAFSF